MSSFAEALILVVVANSVPILVRLLPLTAKFSYPLDCRYRFIDGRRLLGDSKTWRGVAASLFATTLCSAVFQKSLLTGFLVALSAMLGDSFSSFVKRRLGLAPSARAVGLDQVPESLLPFIVLHCLWQLTWPEVGFLTLIFIILDFLLSRILFRLHIRKRPY